MRITKKINSVFTRLKAATFKIRDENEVVEFWLEGFNGDLGNADMKKAFAHIIKIYDQILHEDPNWHYFYEANYSLIRCSLRFRKRMEKYFADNWIGYEYKDKWTEAMYVTKEYQEIFKQMFHTFSVLTIELYKNGDGNQLYLAADRVCHCFHNHAFYLANAEGGLGKYNNIDMWEANNMSRLAVDRSYYIGLIKGRKEVMAYCEEHKNGEAE